MRDIERRLRVLEALPRAQPPPTVLEKIRTLALQHLSDDELRVMMKMSEDLQAGVRDTISEREEEVLAIDTAAIEAEARRMGFKSFADAERRARR